MLFRSQLTGMGVTIIPYAKPKENIQDGEIVRIDTEPSNGDSRYWGGNEAEDSLVIKAGRREMHVDFLSTEYEDKIRLINGLAILVKDRETDETFYLVNRALL